MLSGRYHFHVKQLFHIWRGFRSFYISSATVYEKGVSCLCLLVGILCPSQKDLSLDQCKQIIIRHVLLPFVTFSCVNTTFIFSFRRVVCVSVVSKLTYCLQYGSLAVTRARRPGVALLVALNNFVLYHIVLKAIRFYICYRCNTRFLILCKIVFC